MKKLIYIFFVSASFAILSCDMDKNEGRFEADPSSGWVQFRDAGPETIVYGSQSQIVLPVDLKTAVNANGVDVNYTITDVVGNSTSIIAERSGILSISTTSTGEVVLTNDIVINIADTGLSSTVEFDVRLTSTSSATVDVGLSDGSKPTVIRVKICPFNVGLVYDATAIPSVIPANGFDGLEFDQTLVPVAGTTNQFTVETVWGTTFFPCFIGNCNNVAAIRKWPAIITINPDFTITVVGNDPAFPNRYPTSFGTYDPCTDTFNIPELNQAVLTSNQFTTNVTYRPAQ